MYLTGTLGIQVYKRDNIEIALFADQHLSSKPKLGKCQKKSLKIDKFIETLYLGRHDLNIIIEAPFNFELFNKEKETELDYYEDVRNKLQYLYENKSNNHGTIFFNDIRQSKLGSAFIKNKIKCQNRGLSQLVEDILEIKNMKQLNNFRKKIENNKDQIITYNKEQDANQIKDLLLLLMKKCLGNNFLRIKKTDFHDNDYNNLIVFKKKIKKAFVKIIKDINKNSDFGGIHESIENILVGYIDINTLKKILTNKSIIQKRYLVFYGAYHIKNLKKMLSTLGFKMKYNYKQLNTEEFKCINYNIDDNIFSDQKMNGKIIQKGGLFNFKKQKQKRNKKFKEKLSRIGDPSSRPPPADWAL